MINTMPFEDHSNDLFVFSKKWDEGQVRKHQQRWKERIGFQVYLGAQTGTTW
jgi:hypothetical protein